MKVHLTLYPDTTTGEVVSECGIRSRPGNRVYPKEVFLAHTESVDVCKSCAKAYRHIPQYLK